MGKRDRFVGTAVDGGECSLPVRSEEQPQGSSSHSDPSLRDRVSMDPVIGIDYSTIEA